MYVTTGTIYLNQIDLKCLSFFRAFLTKIIEFQLTYIYVTKNFLVFMYKYAHTLIRPKKTVSCCPMYTD